MIMKQCYGCHKELDSDAVFCPRCGNKVVPDSMDNALTLEDLYKVVIRMENQIQSMQQTKNHVTPQPVGMPPNMPPGGYVIRKKKKSAFNIWSMIITLLVILIMLSVSFIGTVFVNMHASGYTKTSGQVVSELMDSFSGGSKSDIEEGVESLVQ